MSEVNSWSPQSVIESLEDWVKSAKPCGSVNIQKPKKTMTAASTPLFMKLGPVGGKGAQISPLLPELLLGRQGGAPRQPRSAQRVVFSHRIRPASSSRASAEGVLGADARWYPPGTALGDVAQKTTVRAASSGLVRVRGSSGATSLRSRRRSGEASPPESGRFIDTVPGVA